MKNKILSALILSCIFIIFSCASNKEHAAVSVQNKKPQLIEKIKTHKGRRDEPLSGKFSDGFELISMADPNEEANQTFKTIGPTFILVTSSYSPPGISDNKLAISLLSDKKINFFTIPATGDVLTQENRKYIEVATEFAASFNKRMLSLY